MNCRFKTTTVHQLIVSFLLLIALSSSAVTSQNETLFISDIDDTIKNTHVLSTWDTIQNGLRIDNSFYGLSSLFQLMAKTHPEIRFAYVSNAPENLMTNRHQKLLNNAKFPAGDLMMRKDLSDDGHKNRAIRALVEKYQPKNLILIGDNGEQDTLIYAKAAAEFSDLNVKVYIHQVYSVRGAEVGKRLEPEQIGWVTAVDLALSWFSMNEISAQGIAAWASTVVPTILKQDMNDSHGSLAFPKWIDCDDYIPEQLPVINDALLLQYIDQRDLRCKN